MLVQAAFLLPVALGNFAFQRPTPALSAAGRGTPMAAAFPTRRNQPREWTLRTAIAAAPFWWLTLAFFCNEFTQQLLSVHQIAYLTDACRAPLEAAVVAGLLGAVAFPGKLFWGYFADRFGRALAFSLGSGFLLLAVPLLALAGSISGPLTLWAYGIAVGVGFATIGPLAAPMAADLFRGRAFGSIFGAVTISTGFGSAVGVTLAGALYDLTGSYLSALLVAAGTSCWRSWARNWRCAASPSAAPKAPPCPPPQALGGREPVMGRPRWIQGPAPSTSCGP